MKQIIRLSAVFLWGSLGTPAFAKSPQKPAPRVLRTPAAELTTEAASRIGHAKELLGPYYKKSIVKIGESLHSHEEFLRIQVRYALRKHGLAVANAAAEQLLRSAHEHNMDPFFLYAVIENESSFNPAAKGGVGEIGLMQMRPCTAKWVAEKFNLPWNGEQSLFDPVTNIQFGAQYLSMLRNRFDNHGQLYLAAYNMGSGNVRKFLNNKVWPKEYATRVMERYIRLYQELKKEIESENAQIPSEPLNILLFSRV